VADVEFADAILRLDRLDDRTFTPLYRLIQSRSRMSERPLGLVRKISIGRSASAVYGVAMWQSLGTSGRQA
jgi:hypothetical protein